MAHHLTVTATGRHLPYGITQCIPATRHKRTRPALTPAMQAGSRRCRRRRRCCCCLLSSLDRARVVYSYTAENPDELSLQVGDVISVLEMKIEDVGWWKGELNGKVGVFPDNFVELLPPPEVSGHFQHSGI